MADQRSTIAPGAARLGIKPAPDPQGGRRTGVGTKKSNTFIVKRHCNGLQKTGKQAENRVFTSRRSLSEPLIVTSDYAFGGDVS